MNGKELVILAIKDAVEYREDPLQICKNCDHIDPTTTRCLGFLAKAGPIPVHPEGRCNRWTPFHNPLDDLALKESSDG